MFNYLAMMMAISSIFLTIANTPEALGKKTQLWEYLRTVDAGIYHKMKYRAVSAFTNFPGYQGRKLSVRLYRLVPENLQIQLVDQKRLRQPLRVLFHKIITFPLGEG